MKKSGCLILSAGVVLGGAILLAAVYFIMNRETSALTAETRAALPGQFITLSEGVTHYQLAGPAGGQLVVFINGFSVGLFGWEHTVPDLAAAGFRVLTYDLYGRGYSDRPAGPYTLERFVRQLDELLSALQIDRPVDLVSVSMGGYVSAGFAARHPERVRRVLLLAPQAASMASDSRLAAVTLPGLGEYIFAIYMAPVYLADSQGDFKDPRQAEGLRDQYLAAARYAGFSGALLSTLRDMTGDPMLEYRALGRLDKPVLVIWGEDDQTSLYAYAPQVVAAIPQARLRAIPAQRHAVYYERPDLVNPLIVEFLK
jgi:pimeloyl-ACP methyl ester carboxylesterase